MNQREKAERFCSLHHQPEVLVLPNAWDVLSARIFEEAGFPAIATTSAGIANALGYPDGEYISRGEMLEMVHRIAHAVEVPVTADMEAGYGRSPEQLADTAREVIAAGAVGLNLEDAEHEDKLFAIAPQVEKLRAVRQAASVAGVPLVINARTDVYLAGWGAPESRFDQTVRRLKAYGEAGADCLFVPGLRDLDTIRRLVRVLDAPVNVLAVAGTPPIADLKAAGVARVSVGSGPARACALLTQRIAQELRDCGTYTEFTADAMSYDDANRLLRVA